jgi:thiol:disulfide interchange protein DsbG
MRQVLIGRFLLLFALLSMNFILPATSAAATGKRAAIAEKMLTNIDQATWIEEGKSAHIIYVFFDPNCPYCHRIYTNTRDWVKHNKVQMRWIPVGVLTPTSRGKALTLLDSKDPLKLFHHGEDNFVGGEGSAIDEALDGSGKSVKALDNNAKLLRLTGFDAVPSILFRSKKGDPILIEGAPPANKMKIILQYVK